jgi:hypothetical protein
MMEKVVARVRRFDPMSRRYRAIFYGKRCEHPTLRSLI